MKPPTLKELQDKPTAEALELCSKLDWQTRKDLFRQCPATDHRTLLILNVQIEWVMDDGFDGISGIQPGPRANRTVTDYEAVRTFLLQQRSKTANPRRDANKAKAAQVAASGTWFFPEYKKISDVRARFQRIALDHAGIGATSAMNVALFSMNGHFPEDFALASAKTETTCGLFVRACRAAAGILETPSTPWGTGTPAINACIRGPGKADVKYSERGDRVPKPGDIFHVNTKGTHDDHVGIIITHKPDDKGNWIWSTVEGGQPPNGIHTLYFASRMLEFKDGKHWLIRETGKKPLVKWIDLADLASSVPMRLGRRKNRKGYM